MFSRYEYFFVFKIVGYLKILMNCIYVYWVLIKVKVGIEDDDMICKFVVERLFGKFGILFEEIVCVVYYEG